MIKLNTGNLINVTKGFIIHGCNAQGVMQSGVAAHIRLKFPEAYNAYRLVHENEGLIVGNIIPVKINEELVVINAITQKYYGRQPIRYVSYEGLKLCFEKINKLVQENSKVQQSIHFPKIGAGLANGDWSKIKIIIDYSIADVIEKNLWIL